MRSSPGVELLRGPLYPQMQTADSLMGAWKGDGWQVVPSLDNQPLKFQRIHLSSQIKIPVERSPSLNKPLLTSVNNDLCHSQRGLSANKDKWVFQEAAPALRHTGS